MKLKFSFCFFIIAASLVNLDAASVSRSKRQFGGDFFFPDQIDQFPGSTNPNQFPNPNPQQPRPPQPRPPPQPQPRPTPQPQPQQPQQPPQPPQPQQPQQPTTPAPNGNAVTTPSPEFLRCIGSCPSTMEYNPVCGSDDQAYHNAQRLECARRCGANVQMVRGGLCRPRG